MINYLRFDNKGNRKMLNNATKSSIRSWVAEQETLGKSTFSIDDIDAAFPGMSDQVKRNSLQRLKNCRRIISPYRGFYVTVPVSYVARGCLVPPMFYMTQLMEYLSRPYYFGLLSAARIWGASHQLAMTDQVFTLKPQLNTRKTEPGIDWCYRSTYPEDMVVEKKGENGMIRVSNPELTMIDLVQYEQYCGGLSNVATVMAELAESVDFNRCRELLTKYCKGTAIQRTGYILEHVLDMPEPAAVLHDVYKSYYFPRPAKLSTRSQSSSIVVDKKWNIVVNAEIEVDEI